MERRRTLAAEWEDLKAEEFRLLDRAARMIGRKLRDRVEVEVTAAGNREPLFKLLREEIGGRLSETIEALARPKDLSLPQFVGSCRTGPDAVQTLSSVSLTPALAEVIGGDTNIPVLGDAELILGLTAEGEAGAGKAWIAPEHMGSIDSTGTRDRRRASRRRQGCFRDEAAKVRILRVCDEQGRVDRSDPK